MGGLLHQTIYQTQLKTLLQVKHSREENLVDEYKNLNSNWEEYESKYSRIEQVKFVEDCL